MNTTAGSFMWITTALCLGCVPWPATGHAQEAFFGPEWVALDPPDSMLCVAASSCHPACCFVRHRACRLRQRRAGRVHARRHPRCRRHDRRAGARPGGPAGHVAGAGRRRQHIAAFRARRRGDPEHARRTGDPRATTLNASVGHARPVPGPKRKRGVAGCADHRTRHAIGVHRQRNARDWRWDDHDDEGDFIGTRQLRITGHRGPGAGTGRTGCRSERRRAPRAAGESRRRTECGTR